MSDWHPRKQAQPMIYNEDILLTPGEVAEIFRVHPKTVTRWAKKGKIESVSTPGGHKRFWKKTVEKALEEELAG